jgi:hypothetical protein
MFAKSRTESDDPKIWRPYKEMVAPIRTKALSDIVEPNCTKSRTDREEPKRAMP